MSRGLSYEASLDGLRAIAVLAVVLFHTWPRLFPGGWAGVDLFFVLSGYLITSILVREHAATGRVSLRRFYIRRALRLMPALLALIAAFLVYTLVARNDLGEAASAALMAATYVTNWGRAFGAPPSVISHTWSLAIEEQFYLLWPLTLLLILRTQRPWLWAAALAAAGLAWRLYLLGEGAPFVRLYNGFDTHADPILIGCFLALCPRAVSGRAGFLPLIAFGVIVVALDWDSQLANSIGFAVIGCVGAWLIAAASRDGWLKTTLSWPPLVYIGQISYGIYLWHFPIIDVGHYHVPQAYWFILPLLGIACAVVSFHLLEQPFLRLKDKWASKTAPAPAPVRVEFERNTEAAAPGS